MKTLQINRRVTAAQPQVGPIKVYSGPQTPYESGRYQPPVDPTLKIYGGKQPASIRVKLKGAGGAENFTINEFEFDSEIHNKING